ncbi:EamA/RhaT family transporter [Pseudoalteromonas phenolica]|uniref:EamA/RhaT family transporter n=1 Tax=Pseudoalteromonas phenolica TaxID=161398 RepID=A0A4Q7IKX8_9GAMM|nr:DMT family transporter [Pseudoalteromonas phenolica]RZQ52305.1 EamA/RhaT family transporter [Pseudoalteromonas phenolica]
MHSLQQSENSNDVPVVLALVTAMLFWGASWISGKIIADMAPAKLTVFYRLALATISMLPILFFVHKLKLVKLRFSQPAMLWSLPAGLLLAGYNQLFFLGLHDGLPGKGGMLVTTINPIMTFALAAIFNQQKFRPLQLVGMLLGLTGGMMMIEIWHFDNQQVFASGNLFFILAALSWAFLTLVSQRGTQFADFMTFSALMYLWASILSYIFAIEHSPFSSISHYPALYWQHMLFLSVIVVSIATSVFFLANQKIGPSRSSSFIFVVPVTAMGLSVWYFDETIPLSVAFGGAFALAAVYLINTSKQ